MDIKSTILRACRHGDVLFWLIVVNVLMLVVEKLVAWAALTLGIPGVELSYWLYLPSVPAELLQRPWTVLTYAVMHTGFWHMACNVLTFYWFGYVFMEIYTSKQMLIAYVCGALGGALFFMLGYQLIPSLVGLSDTLAGSSAAVMAIVVATTMRAPNYRMGVLFFGSVKVKWIGLVLIAIMVLSIRETNENFGGDISHIGGMAAGFLFALATTRWRLPRWMRGGKSQRTNDISQKTTYVPWEEVEESELDEILAKIKQSGYASLTDEEKRKLFHVSKKGTNDNPQSTE